MDITATFDTKHIGTLITTGVNELCTRQDVRNFIESFSMIIAQASPHLTKAEKAKEETEGFYSLEVIRALNLVLDEECLKDVKAVDRGEGIYIVPVQDRKYGYDAFCSNLALDKSSELIKQFYERIVAGGISIYFLNLLECITQLIEQGATSIMLTSRDMNMLNQN
jgi:hypothetical protein